MSDVLIKTKIQIGYVENLPFVTHEAIALRALIVLMLAVLRSSWHSLAITGEIFNNTL